MIKIVTVLSCLLFPISVLAQQLKVFKCDKAYKEWANGTYYDDDFPEMYQYDELFEGACSWRCNYLIHLDFYIHKKQDSTLTDGSISNGFIGNAKEIEAILFLAKDSLHNDNEEEEKVEVTGFLISNGNRTSREDYLHYSRVKSIRVLVNDVVIGTAIIEDSPKAQYVSFEQAFSLDKKVNIRLQVVSLYAGEVPEYAIAELWFDGTGGHTITPKMCFEK